jgi:hypothetical protein
MKRFRVLYSMKENLVSVNVESSVLLLFSSGQHRRTEAARCDFYDESLKGDDQDSLQTLDWLATHTS